MRSTLFALATYNNQVLPSPVMPGMPPTLMQSSGLREEEVRLASRGLAATIPCLKYLARIPKGVNERELALYDNLADMVSVLQVCTPSVVRSRA